MTLITITTSTDDPIITISESEPSSTATSDYQLVSRVDRMKITNDVVDNNSGNSGNGSDTNGNVQHEESSGNSGRRTAMEKTIVVEDCVNTDIANITDINNDNNKKHNRVLTQGKLF